MARSSTTSVAALWVLFGALALSGCGDKEGGLPPEDLQIFAEQLEMTVEGLPMEPLVLTLQTFVRPGDTTIPPQAVPFTKPEAQAVVDAWAEYVKILREEPRWRPQDGALTPEQRAREERRLVAMRAARDRVRALLRPRQAWAENHYGAEGIRAFLGAGR